ncbi:16145_t:CDS:2 [Funneliformis caledonium]|uniref:deoxyhypusine synthase n=1 Tax=Funneliformis caledonium TaxID=1117310 RepID=A0A9N9H7J8_9GLOM|nr:16145_t:CDS:2 [Funneliformis caledonium]
MEKSTSLNGNNEKSKDEILAALKTATTSVFLRSTPMPENAMTVKGPDFNHQLSLHELLDGYSRIGFQATSVGKAIELINKMRKWRLSHEPILPDEIEEYKEPLKRCTTKCKIFLGYTSNLVSSGLREIIRYLVQHSLVDVIVTTAGGVEEDFIKCLGQTYLADFQLNGSELRKNGMNRIGNLVVPNDNYCKFEDWVLPILDKLLEEQRSEVSLYCPALTDGSLGDLIYFHTFKNPGLVIDIVSDIRSINQQAVFAKKTGVIILGGGLVKHHICNANLMRNGADYAVYINTGQEFDGSDSGARPDEAVSWGKIRTDAEHVKVYADATIVFPLIVSETFVKEVLDQCKN